MFSTHYPSSTMVFEYVIRAHRLRGAALIYLVKELLRAARRRR
jgi:hypothetical protein